MCSAFLQTKKDFLVLWWSSKWWICWLTVLFCSPLSLYANSSPLLLTEQLVENVGVHRLDPYIDFLAEGEAELTVQTVSSLEYQDKFQKGVAGEQIIDRGFTTSAHWFRLNIKNQTSEPDWYFELQGSLSRKVDVYLVDSQSGGYFQRQNLIPHSKPLKYKLMLEPGSSQYLYFRLSDAHSPLSPHPVLATADQLLKQVMVNYPLYSFLVGGLLTLILYNLFYFFYLRDMTFLSVSVFILGLVIEFADHSGVGRYFSWVNGNLDWLGRTFAFICIAAAVKLVTDYLEVRQHLPGIYRWFQVIFWLSCLLIPLHFLLGRGTAIAGGLALIMLLITGIARRARYQQGFRGPIALKLAVLIMLLSFVPAMLRGMAVIPDIAFLTEITYFTMLLSLILLSLVQAERVSQKSQEAERISASMQAKDDFLTTMSHELRTPMNAVINASRLLEQTRLSKQQRNYVSRLNTSSQHMLSLVDDILDLNRLDRQLQHFECVPFQLSTILRQTEQLIIGQAKKKNLTLKLENNFHILKKQLQGDPVRLQQVLLNLLNNAVKFTNEGEIRLTITPVSLDNTSVVLLFEVRDTGIGISSEQHKSVFQPFSQLDSSRAREYRGSGLGLAISYRLVQHMQGNLQVESYLGLGSCFYFQLSFPLVDLLPEEHVTNNQSVLVKPLKSVQVLLVDDDEMNRFFGSEVLSSIGISVETAESGKTAVERVMEKSFDLIFMDVSMPEIDGYETTRRIRALEAGQKLRIVALTAHALLDEWQRCKAAGMDDYLSKPFDIETIRRTLDKWVVE